MEACSSLPEMTNGLQFDGLQDLELELDRHSARSCRAIKALKR
jgi:hypothetical protein